jgi:hypothetical protein
LGKKPKELRVMDGVGVSYGEIRGLVVTASVRVCSTIAPGVYGAKLKFGKEKLGAI